MSKPDIKKQIILNMPYLFAFYFADKLSALFRTAAGVSVTERLSAGLYSIGTAFKNPLPSFHYIDILVGIAVVGLLKLALHIKSKNRKKYRHGEEYWSARWSA